MTVKYFEHNTQGIDYVVGDLHGCYLELMSLLKHVNFDYKTDRLFSVGDLVDRGEFSLDCAKLVNKPWFHAVQGNHEKLMYESIIVDNNKPDQFGLWLSNGGQWFYSAMDSEGKEELTRVAQSLKELPLIIVIGKDSDNRVNIVHAELYTNEHSEFITDEHIDNYEVYFDEFEINNAVWGRRLIQSKKQFIKDIDNPFLSTTYVGHTPVDEPIELLNHRYIDTAACFWYKQQYENAKLTMVRIKDETVYQYVCSTGAVEEIHPFSK